jgi:hypothetical protein
MSCYGPMAAVVNVMVKRRDIRLRHVRMREVSANEPLVTHRNNYRWHQNRRAVRLREEHGGYLLTGHAVSGVEAARLSFGLLYGT